MNIKKEIKSFVFLDKDDNEIARHTFNGIVVLASPDALETTKLPKDDKGGFPLISYQFGEPQIVLALVRTLQEILPDVFKNWVQKMEDIKNTVIDGEIPKGGEIWTPSKKLN